MRDGLWESRKGTATLGEVEAFEVAADDCKKAFRREPTGQVIVVYLYNPWTRRAEMIILPCFVLGCFSAVHGWNCYSHLLTHAGRRLAAVPVTGYFDDFQIYGTPRDCASSQYTLGAMFDPLIGFDLAKHMAGDQIRITLGVRCDFSRVPCPCAILSLWK